MKTIAIIPAGGIGKRSGFMVPKQYVKFNNKELIAFTLQVFQKNKHVDEIIVAASKEYFPLLQKIKKNYRLTKLKKIISGGKERQDSVFNALLAADAEGNDLVAVHDAARPLLPQEILTSAINTAKLKGNALVCLRPGDTLITGHQFVKSYLNREEIYYVQTPQVFKYQDLLMSMKKAQKNNFIGTDESILIKRLGKRIHIVEGSQLNFKITTKQDIQLFKQIIKN